MTTTTSSSRRNRPRRTRRLRRERQRRARGVGAVRRRRGGRAAHRRGYSAEMTHSPRRAVRGGRGGRRGERLGVSGRRRGAGRKTPTTSRAATLLALCTDREDPESHRALALKAVGPPGPGGEGPSVAFELSGAFAIDDDETAGLVGPYAHARRVREWDVALASHRKAWDNQLCAVRPPARKPDGSIAPPCVLDVEDDRCVPSIPLAGEDEDSNFVVGLALDTTGCGGRMPHPADKSRPKLPQGPLVLVATADARLTCMRLGNMDEDAGVRFEAARVRPRACGDPRVPRARGLARAVAARERGEDQALREPGGGEGGARHRAHRVDAASAVQRAWDEFGAAFLAKANAGYAKAQKALEEELEASAKPASAAFPAAPAPGSAPAFNFVRRRQRLGGARGAARGDVVPALGVPRSGRRRRRPSVRRGARVRDDRRRAGSVHVHGRHRSARAREPWARAGRRTPPSGGKAKDAASTRVGRKAGTCRRAETKPAAAGGFFGSAEAPRRRAPRRSPPPRRQTRRLSPPPRQPAAGGLALRRDDAAAAARGDGTALVPPAGRRRVQRSAARRLTPARRAGRPAPADPARSSPRRLVRFRGAPREPEARGPRARPRAPPAARRATRPAERCTAPARAPAAPPPERRRARARRRQGGLGERRARSARVRASGRGEAGALDMASRARSSRTRLGEARRRRRRRLRRPRTLRLLSAKAKKAPADRPTAACAPMLAGAAPRRGAPGAFGKDRTQAWGQVRGGARARGGAGGHDARRRRRIAARTCGDGWRSAGAARRSAVSDVARLVGRRGGTRR